MSFIEVMKKIKWVLVILAVLAATGCIFYIGVKAGQGGDGEPAEKTTVVSESSIRAVLEKLELRSPSYRNTGMLKVLDEKGRMLYSVSYEGFLTTGIRQFPSVRLDKAEKFIVITVPKTQIIEKEVNVNSMNFIFTKGRYNKDMVFNDAYALCLEDLEESFGDEARRDFQTETDKSIMALVKQVLGSEYSEYYITINHE